MNKRPLLFFLLTCFIGGLLHAQDSLPKFTVKNAGNNRIVVGWYNNLPNVRQISIQRSFDSLSGFKTILTVADPSSPQNGYVDTRATNDHMFYRLYILQEKGLFTFSGAQKPVWDSLQASMVNTYADPVNDADTASLKNRPDGFIPSAYVFTNRDGYVRIRLPDNEKPKKYSIKFFEEDDRMLFEIKEIKEKNFKIDKANFYHAGWFRFELYEDGKLFERHKFYLEKEF